MNGKGLHGTPQSKAFFQDISASLEKAEFRFPKAMITLDNDNDNDEGDEDDDEDHEDDEDDEDDNVGSSGGGSDNDEAGDEQQLSPIFATTALNDCLFDLTHSLETIPIALSEAKANTRDSVKSAADVGALEGDLEPPYTYLVNVRDKFPSAEDRFIRDLAELNWARHKDIREMRSAQKTEDLDTTDIEEKIHSHAQDSGYQTISHLANNKPHTSKSTSSSIASFGATTNAKQVGRTIYPPPPVKVGPESGPFQCTICYRMLEGITTTLDWR
jgi:hypothetical protein